MFFLGIVVINCFVFHCVKTNCHFFGECIYIYIHICFLFFKAQQGLMGQVYRVRHIPSQMECILKRVDYVNGGALELRALNSVKGIAHCVQVLDFLLLILLIACSSHVIFSLAACGLCSELSG